MPVNIKGKSYKTVAERILEVHNDTAGIYNLNTEILTWEEGRIVMRATLTIPRTIMENGEEQNSTYTGHAYEEEGTSQVNETSALENCETSAIGRAIAAAGYVGGEFGAGSYASANEVENAIHQQKKAKPKQPPKNISKDIIAAAKKLAAYPEGPKVLAEIAVNSIYSIPYKPSGKTGVPIEAEWDMVPSQHQKTVYDLICNTGIALKKGAEAKANEAQVAQDDLPL
jgi:hypothetical protein